MAKVTQQKQVNIRLDDETLARIDKCRSTMMEEVGTIPTRSDVVRYALDDYLKKCDKK